MNVARYGDVSDFARIEQSTDRIGSVQKMDCAFATARKPLNSLVLNGDPIFDRNSVLITLGTSPAFTGADDSVARATGAGHRKSATMRPRDGDSDACTWSFLATSVARSNSEWRDRHVN